MSKAPRKRLNDAMDAVMASAGSDDAGDQEAPATEPMPDRIPQMPDGRSLRATGRTHQFSTRVHPDTHNDMKWLALEDRITLGELLDRMVAAYKRQRGSR